MAQHRATLRKSLRSALKHRKLADSLLDSMAELQTQWNAAMDKLDADAGGAGTAATATLDLTADITLTSVALGSARNTTTFTLEVEAAAANPTDTILADFTGTAAAIVLTITPNDGTNNGATPVDLTTAELAELINTGAVAGKTVTVTDASSLRALQTAAGGDATALADAGEGDGEVATFAGGTGAAAGLDTDYVATVSVSQLLSPDAEGTDAQHKASFRKSLQSALSHRRLANTILDSMSALQTNYNAMLAKLDAEAGTLDDTDYESTLAVTATDYDAAGSSAQHKASLRRSLESALAHRRLANAIADAMEEMEASFNGALAQLDTGTVSGQMAAFKVTAIDPDAE